MHSCTSFSSKTEILFILGLFHVLFPLPDNLFNLLHQTNFYSPFCAQLLNHVQLFATPWTVAHQAPLPVGFPRQHTGVGCHVLLQGIFPTQGSNPHLLHLESFTAEPSGMPTHPLGLTNMSLTREVFPDTFSESHAPLLFSHYSVLP